MELGQRPAETKMIVSALLWIQSWSLTTWFGRERQWADIRTLMKTRRNMTLTLYNRPQDE